MSWATFKTNLEKELKDRALSSDEPVSQVADLADLAKKIVDLYHIEATNSVDGFFRPILARPLFEPGKAAIESAIVSSLTLMFNANLKPSIMSLSPIGLATAAYWAPAIIPGTISLSPPTPPTTIPLPGSFVVFPGNPMAVTNGFYKAFTSYNNEGDFEASLSKVAQDITDGFSAHMTSIAGLWIGATPAYPIVPVPIPWVGMTPI